MTALALPIFSCPVTLFRSWAVRACYFLLVLACLGCASAPDTAPPIPPAILDEPVAVVPDEPASPQEIAGEDELARATRHLEAGELDRAGEMVAAYLEQHPESAEAVYVRGRVDFARKRYPAAVADFEQAIALDEGYVDAYLRLGEALAEQIHFVLFVKKLPMAERIHAAFLRAAELDPESTGAHTALARFYSEAPEFAGGDFEKSVHHARELIRLDPREGHLLLSSIYDRFEKPELAIEEVTAAIAADPEHAESYRRAAALFEKTDQVDVALDMRERASALEGLQVSGHQSLGRDEPARNEDIPTPDRRR